MNVNFCQISEKHLIAAGSKAHEESKNKSKTVVNLESMKEELKQLEDPPLTQRDKDLMASRLTESFFDQPCEQLAQNLLGFISALFSCFNLIKTTNYLNKTFNL